jgi:hypothetical protein
VNPEVLDSGGPAEGKLSIPVPEHAQLLGVGLSIRGVGLAFNVNHCQGSKCMMQCFQWLLRGRRNALVCLPKKETCLALLLADSLRSNTTDIYPKSMIEACVLRQQIYSPKA